MVKPDLRVQIRMIPATLHALITVAAEADRCLLREFVYGNTSHLATHPYIIMVRDEQVEP